MRFKDINECLQAGLSALVIMGCVENELVIKPDLLKSAADFRDEIWNQFFPGGKEDNGLPFLFGEEFPLRTRYREVSVWSGFAGHGKSQLLGDYMVYLAGKHNERICIASFEMAAERTYYRCIRQATGCKRPFTKEEPEKFDRIIEWMNDRIYVYHHQGAANLDEVLPVWRYARRRYGVRQFVLDSMMMTTMSSGDEQYGEQNTVMQKLCDFADVENVHVHIVSHSKKLKNEKEYPRLYDIAGSAAIPNKAFNAYIVWRNKEKEQAIMPLYEKDTAYRKACELSQTMENEAERVALLRRFPPLNVEEVAEVEEMQEKKDAYFLCEKQRNGEGVLPVKEMWFHRESLQFHTEYGAKPTNYLGDLHQLGFATGAGEIEFAQERQTPDLTGL